MEQQQKILMIDKAADRKKRIMALKEHGFTVHPALKIAEARNRCKSGSYDLIIVNSEEAWDEALELCQSIRQRSPHQALLLMASDRQIPAAPEYLVSSDPEQLVVRVEELLGKRPATTLSLAA